MIKLRVLDIVKDEDSDYPLVLLCDEENRVLPIFIGHSEGIGIALALKKKDFWRPLTHKLMAEILVALNAQAEYVYIKRVQDATFYATVRLKQGRKTKDLDCRPSDGMALALNTGCSIYASQELMLKAERYPKTVEPTSRKLKIADGIVADLFAEAEKSKRMPSAEKMKNRRDFQNAIDSHINRLLGG